MDFADKLDMMDDDCDIEGFPCLPDNHEDICKKAWELYRSPEKENIADYTKYDALFDITKDMGIKEEEYDELMDKMQYE